MVDSTWVIVTPDADVYAENLALNSPDISRWRFRPGPAGVPFGIDVADVYDFAAPPSDQQLDATVVKAETEAR